MKICPALPGTVFLALATSKPLLGVFRRANATIRAEIEHTRRQIHRQRKDIRSPQRAGIPAGSAEELLARMQTKVDELCPQRHRMIGESRRKYEAHKSASAGSGADAVAAYDPLKWYDDKADNPP